MLEHLLGIISLQCPLFSDKETEVQKMQIGCWKSNRQVVTELALELQSQIPCVELMYLSPIKDNANNIFLHWWLVGPAILRVYLKDLKIKDKLKKQSGVY